jgi:hypothetical protein
VLNPLDAPGAVTAAADPLERLLSACNHAPSVNLRAVIQLTGMKSDHAPLSTMAQAVYDAGGGTYEPPSVIEVTSVTEIVSPRTWRSVLRREATEGFLMPHDSVTVPPRAVRSPAEIRRAGELADAVADLIEAYLGPVRTAAEVDALGSEYGPHGLAMQCRDLLLLTGGWATILHLAMTD